MSLDTLLPQLQDEAPVSAVDLAALSSLDGENRDRFLEVWRGLSIQRRRNIVDRLSEITEDNVELDFTTIFMTGLVDDDVQVRADSVKALWEYEGNELVAVLTRLLKDPEAIVRAEAALGLGRFLLRAELMEESGSRIDDIENALREIIRDEDELVEVRGRAIEAVGVRGHDWVHDLIEDAYASGDRRLQISAVHAMGRNADLDWLPTITDEMHSDDPEMRFEAATAAGALAAEDAIPELATLTLDDDSEVQEAAIAALGLIGGNAARNVLNELASETEDERILAAVSEALAEAEFLDDPMSLKLHLDQSIADDTDEDEFE